MGALKVGMGNVVVVGVRLARRAAAVMIVGRRSMVIGIRLGKSIMEVMVI